jgi:hypothetical protein
MKRAAIFFVHCNIDVERQICPVMLFPSYTELSSCS